MPSPPPTYTTPPSGLRVAQRPACSRRRTGCCGGATSQTRTSLSPSGGGLEGHGQESSVGAVVRLLPDVTASSGMPPSWPARPSTSPSSTSRTGGPVRPARAPVASGCAVDCELLAIGSELERHDRHLVVGAEQLRGWSRRRTRCRRRPGRRATTPPSGLDLDGLQRRSVAPRRCDQLGAPRQGAQQVGPCVGRVVQPHPFDGEQQRAVDVVDEQRRAPTRRASAATAARSARFACRSGEQTSDHRDDEQRGGTGEQRPQPAVLAGLMTQPPLGPRGLGALPFSSGFEERPFRGVRSGLAPVCHSRAWARRTPR